MERNHSRSLDKYARVCKVWKHTYFIGSHEAFIMLISGTINNIAYKLLAFIYKSILIKYNVLCDVTKYLRHLAWLLTIHRVKARSAKCMDVWLLLV